MNDVGEDPERAIELKLALLRLEHQDLDSAVRAVEDQALPDQLLVARLKKRKLQLRDQIVVLEDQLTPDIIA